MLLTNKDLKIKINSETATHGIFEFDPLPKGFGYTLGNTFRRVLLTSLEGAAVTSIKVKGANHQFSTLDGVKEDLVQIILNLKQIRFKSFSDNPTVATLKAKGVGKVTAAAVSLPSDLEIMNKDLHLATLADAKSEIEIEMVIEKGFGYSPEEERPNTKVGVIVIDAMFSPVNRVQITVQETRSGTRVDLDKLILAVDTDGSIKPSLAISQSAQVLQGFFKTIAEWQIDTSKEEKSTPTEANASNMMQKSHDVAVEDLPLQTRTINALKKHGLNTLEELAGKSDDELAEIKNLGDKSVKEIINLLEEEGLR